MLLDEPFGAIDAVTRASLQDELLRMHRGSGKTFIFVTHDVAEAMKLATKILVVDAGRVQQYASPQELVARPATPFVRELLSTQGFLPSWGPSGDVSPSHAAAPSPADGDSRGGRA